MNDPSLLQVLVGASRLPVDEHQPILIIEAEEERLESLRLQLSRGQRCFPVQMVKGILAATPEVEVTWHRFNDKRMNGVLPLEQWQVAYPNIQMNSQEACKAQTLATILSAWPAARDSQDDIYLTISQGSPIDALNGSGDWLQRIKRISIQSPQAKMLWLDVCDSWMQQHGFRQDHEDPLTWNIDPLATELIHKKAEINALAQRHKENEEQHAKREQELLAEINALAQRQKESQEQHAKREQELLAALSHVFPYSSYRDKRPDLVKFKDQELVNHFVLCGIKEGVDLQFISVHRELQRILEEKDKEAAKFELLDNKMRQTAQQLEVLKELFARLMVNA